MVNNPTTAQLKIYDFIENGTGNGIIDAVAGAGKTTTLMECVSHIQDINDVIYCAFNTSIQKEIQKRFKKENKNVKVCTIHALGFKMLCATKKFQLNDSKYSYIVKEPKFFETLVPDIDVILCYHSHPSVAELRRLDEMRDALDWSDVNLLNEGQRYVTRIIFRLLDINQKYRCTLEKDGVENYDQMIKHYGIIPYWEQEYPTYSNEISAYYRLHQKLLKEGNSMAISHGIIDFTDQLYLPTLMNLSPQNKYGFVFVDECQDLSKAQVRVVEKYLRADGRLLAVGDPYQAIYGFAGADCNSFERVRKSFNCTDLKLTDCFRCPQDVIKLAQTIRSDINGFKEEKGKIYRIHSNEVIVNIKSGDLVICRTRRPLRDLALNLINKDFKVKIHPDELQEFMGDYKRNFTQPELRRTLNDENIDVFFDQAKERNRKRITKENQNADPIIRKILIKEEVATMETTLDFLKKKYFDWQLNTLETILKRLKLMLSNPSDEAIKISTIHRAKGLENDRVFILEYNKLPPPRDLEWERVQERNLHYVAVTRPKEELYLCDAPANMDSDEPDENAQPAQPVNLAVTEPIKPVITVKDFESKMKEEQSNPFSELVNSEIEPKNLFPAPNPFEDKDETNDTDSFLDMLNTCPPINSSTSIKIRPTLLIQKVPDKFYAFDEQEETPYASLILSCQKAKYWSVVENFEGTVFSLIDIISSQYLDVYRINTPNGIEEYNGYYKKSGLYSFSPHGTCVNAEEVLCLLEDESNYKIKFDYKPQTEGFEAVHELIQATCEDLKICNTNIYKENYTIVYCFKSSCSYFYLKIMYNGKKIITSIAPFSTLGENDDKLNQLLENLKHLWQR